MEQVSARCAQCGRRMTAEDMEQRAPGSPLNCCILCSPNAPHRMLDRSAYERYATKRARANHEGAPLGTFAARVRAEVSCAMQGYDVAAHRRATS